MRKTFTTATLGLLLATGVAGVDITYCHGGVSGTCANITFTAPAVKTCFTPAASVGTIDTIIGLTSGVRYTVHTATGCTAASSSATFATGTNNLVAPFRNTVRSISASILWVSNGCFTDLDAGSRTLAAATLNNPNMTIDMCQDFCNTGGFGFAGVEFGRECYCDYSVQFPGQLAASQTDCNVPCGGNVALNCGGASRMNVFNNRKPLPATPANITGPNATRWASRGCFTDNSIGVRTLPLHLAPASGLVTPQSCVTTCSNAGQTWAGVEFGTECWCGRALNPNATAVAAVQCGTACPADPAFFCGDNNRINLFQLNSTVTP